MCLLLLLVNRSLLHDAGVDRAELVSLVDDDPLSPQVLLGLHHPFFVLLEGVGLIVGSILDWDDLSVARNGRKIVFHGIDADFDFLEDVLVWVFVGDEFVALVAGWREGAFFAVGELGDAVGLGGVFACPSAVLFEI